MEPITIGKPSRLIFDCLRKDHGLEDEPLNKFLMIGDNLNTDILFGNTCGVDTLLVLSGNTSAIKARKVKIDGQKAHDEGTPTYISPYFSYSTKIKF